MYRVVFPSLAMLSLVAAVAIGLGFSSPETVRGDVGGVYSDVPVFEPDQIVTITVTAEDDDGTLVIESSLQGSKLTVITCSGIGPDQTAGECDGSGDDSVFDQGEELVRIDTNTLDEDDDTELLTVTLTMVASCEEPTSVTVSGDQPGNHGPDDVTINCQPSTPTPTPSPTPSPSPTPTATATQSATPAATSTPPPTATPQPPAAPVSEVQQTIITPPSTGSAGLR